MSEDIGSMFKVELKRSESMTLVVTWYAPDVGTTTPSPTPQSPEAPHVIHCVFVYPHSRKNSALNETELPTTPLRSTGGLATAGLMRNVVAWSSGLLVTQFASPWQPGVQEDSAEHRGCPEADPPQSGDWRPPHCGLGLDLAQSRHQKKLKWHWSSDWSATSDASETIQPRSSRSFLEGSYSLARFTKDGMDSATVHRPFVMHESPEHAQSSPQQT